MSGRFLKLSPFLRKAREKSGLSQGEVAKRLGYASCQFVSNWERGIAAPPMAVIKSLSAIYGLNPEKLFWLIVKDAEHQMRKEYLEEK